MAKPVIEPELELEEREEIPRSLPVLPLKDVVVFPGMIMPLLVGRDASMQAVNSATVLSKYIFLTAQKDVNIDDPGRKDLHRVGVIARILQVLKLPNGLLKVLVEGIVRGKLVRFFPQKGHFYARIQELPQDDSDSLKIQGALRRMRTLFKEYILVNRDIPDEVQLAFDQMQLPYQIADFVSAHIQASMEVKQELLEMNRVHTQLLKLAEMLETEREILEVERAIEKTVRGRLQKSQRNYYLQEQLRAIQEELGEEHALDDEFSELSKKIQKAGMAPEALEKANEELDKLRKTTPMSPESTVIRNYLDWLLAVPWKQRSKDRLDLDKAAAILNEDHYGLEKPKDRILEHLAVVRLVKRMKGPILCFVGPPGVGKTSLGKSIARAMGRKFVRISLGGVRDEAEIRGHRRTYIGSLPGKIIQSMKRAGTVNPVFLLDEVDKMSRDFRGDPAAALLEVLDPEQNKNFNDHYLEVDYDLSQVFFITTANVRHDIPSPLLDRMEIIDLPGYLEHDKLSIARDFLIPKQLTGHGLKPEIVGFADRALLDIIRLYTQEAGVRNLEREIGTVCRRIARQIAGGSGRKHTKVSARNLPGFLGVPKFTEKHVDQEPRIGTATGLAWTPFGGDVLSIEVSVMEGKERLTLTGKLGDVMKESAQAALSYIRSNARALGVDLSNFGEREIHVHVPEGAISKDGPSAGVTMAVAMLSALTDCHVDQRVAMTGEITLRGNVLPVGGLNEKLLAARRVGVRKVLLPLKNEKDIAEVPPPVRRGLEIVKVSHMDEVLPHVLCSGEAD